METTDQRPTYIYSYNEGTNKLYRTNLVNDEQVCLQVSYQFMMACCWSDLPGGSLIITGGYPVVKEVVRIDTLRDYADTLQPPMLTARRAHCAVYYNRHLYVFGGINSVSPLEECERFVCAEKRWEALPPLPQSCFGMSGVVMEGSLYALGGYYQDYLDLIQRLSLSRLTWEVMQLRLPHADQCIACFQHNNKVYFVVNKTLYSLKTLQALKPLPKNIHSYGGPSYYSRGTLYCSTSRGGAAERVEIGSLIN